MGRAIAETLAADGASVAVLARGKAALDETVEQLRLLGAPEVLGIAADMGDTESVEAAIAEVGSHWGRLNVLVHTTGPSAGYFEQMSDAEWEASIFTRHHGCRAGNTGSTALTAFRRMGAHRHIERSLDPASKPADRCLHSSKAALSSVTKNLSKSLAPEGILVNCVCPGTIVTASFTEGLVTRLPPKASTRPTRSMS